MRVDTSLVSICAPLHLHIACAFHVPVAVQIMTHNLKIRERGYVGQYIQDYYRHY